MANGIKEGSCNLLVSDSEGFSTVFLCLHTFVETKMCEQTCVMFGMTADENTETACDSSAGLEALRSLSQQ